MRYQATASNVLDLMTSLGGGIVLSIGSFILIIHWFGGGKLLIGFEWSPIWIEVPFQSVMWIWGCNHWSSSLVIQTIDRCVLGRAGWFLVLWYLLSMVGILWHVSICGPQLWGLHLSHSYMGVPWSDPLLFVGMVMHFGEPWFCRVGFSSGVWWFYSIGRWHILWHIWQSICSFWAIGRFLLFF